MNKHSTTSSRRQYDHADIDGRPVKTGGTGSTAFVLQRIPPVTNRSEAAHSTTEDDQDIELPVDDRSHYGDDVERDSDS